ETSPGPAAIEQLCGAAPEAPRAHVVLSANVFTASLRAIALALASSERVFVRPSRREPIMAELLHAACGGQFEIASALDPAPGDHVWAYGADETLAAIAASLPRGVVYYAHGFGYGAALLDSAACRDAEIAQQLALDVALFDQRGCLSPRFAVVHAPLDATLAFARSLAAALDDWRERLPLGHLDAAEREASVRFHETMTYAGECCLGSNAGSVAVLREPERFPLPPVGRNLLLLSTNDWRAPLVANAAQLTQLGIAGSFAALPAHVRIAALGHMQRPPFDGPVDRRTRARVLS
ncbi:MAG TPA: acyl-CoA reductase, partial [Polyangiaceae bacterium]|nr:acyl-CoA reductase [Polyangiaceae bacterium]